MQGLIERQREHLERALAEADDQTSLYHLRSALQYCDAMTMLQMERPETAPDAGVDLP